MVLLWWLAPMSALLPASASSPLPACCRRNGAHHCAMASTAMAQSGQNASKHGVSAPAHCPLYHHSLPATAGVFALLLPDRRTDNVEARFRIAAPRVVEFEHTYAHDGRGPPTAG